MTPQYIIEYDEIKDLSISDSLRLIESVPGKSLKELKVMDLSYRNGELLYPGTGVYLFRKGSEIQYVGKAESMSFTERIAKHFDPRPYAWFNRLLEVVGTEMFQHSVNKYSDPEEFRAASQEVFGSMNLVLIHFKDRNRIARTERMLRASTECLNKFKRLKERNLEKIVGEY